MRPEPNNSWSVTLSTSTFHASRIVPAVRLLAFPVGRHTFQTAEDPIADPARCRGDLFAAPVAPFVVRVRDTDRREGASGAEAYRSSRVGHGRSALVPVVVGDLAEGSTAIGPDLPRLDQRAPGGALAGAFVDQAVPMPLHSPVGLVHAQRMIGCLVRPSVRPHARRRCAGDLCPGPFASMLGLYTLDDRLRAHARLCCAGVVAPPVEPHRVTSAIPFDPLAWKAPAAGGAGREGVNPTAGLSTTVGRTPRGNPVCETGLPVGAGQTLMPRRSASLAAWPRWVARGLRMRRRNMSCTRGSRSRSSGVARSASSR